MKRIASTLCELALVLGFVPVAAAQEQSVSVTGVVKDSSGEVLPGATVELRNASAGVSTAVANGEGVVRVPALPPGTYEISASLQGFKPSRKMETVLELGKNLSLDLVLALASVSEEVSVTSSESSPRSTCCA